MPAPTMVQQAATIWDTNQGTKTMAVGPQAGDAVVVWAAMSNSGTNNTLSISAPGWTFTLQQSIAISGSWGGLYCWTAIAENTGSVVLTLTSGGGSGVYGMHIQVWRGHGGIGNSAKANASGAPLSSMNTSANSAVSVFSNDYNSVDGATRTWRTSAGPLTETIYNRDGTRMTVYGGYHPSVSQGTNEFGLLVPSQKYSTISLELLASSSNVTPIADAGASQTVEPYSLVTLDGGNSEDPDGNIESYTWTQISGPTITLADAGVSRTFTAPGVLEETILEFGLTVTDDQGATSAVDITTVTVLPVAERAVIGGVQIPIRITAV